MERSTSTAVRKRAWTKEEDDLLRECIHKYGEGRWHLVPQRTGLKRCRKSCRLRWTNYLKPTIKRGDFQEDEVDLIKRLHRLLGNRWSLIAGRLPGRTANDVKNFFHTHLKKVLAASENNGNRKWMIPATPDDDQFQRIDDPLPTKPQPTNLVNTTTTPLLTAGTAPSDGNLAANLIPSSPENWTEWWANLLADLEDNVDNDGALASWDELGEAQNTNQYWFQESVKGTQEEEALGIAEEPNRVIQGSQINLELSEGSVKTYKHKGKEKLEE